MVVADGKSVFETNFNLFTQAKLCFANTSENTTKNKDEEFHALNTGHK